jgi:hypothetical protein
MKAPIGYSLIPNTGKLAIIEKAIVGLAEGKASLREAADQLKDKLGHSVSHEWVRSKLKAFKKKQLQGNQND